MVGAGTVMRVLLFVCCCSCEYAERVQECESDVNGGVSDGELWWRCLRNMSR